ncbi:enoyl-CoA hydratase/isomerase family protein [Arthrobacter alpinus]|nr:enoyl-CoA hydratase/isomerase family protein [Arthrobacter alpinus]
MSEATVQESNNTIRWDQDADGVVILTMDDPNQSANTMNGDYSESMQAVVERLAAEKETITGVVLASAKKTFFAGGDLKDLIASTPEDAAKIFELGQKIKAQLRTLETLGKPVVAAINGAALGGGLEIALAAHHRIAADTRGSVIGLPEVTLGLLPGGGGIVRTVRLMGIADATMKVLLQGQKYKPRKALEIGLVHEVVDTVEELIPAAKAWIAANPEAVQPWDAPKYRIPGGTPAPRTGRKPAGLPGESAQAAQGRQLPGPARHPGRRRRKHAGGFRHGAGD